MRHPLEESKSVQAIFSVFDYTKTALLLIVLVLLLYYLVFQVFFVRGLSMDPSFFDGEMILVDRASYYFRDPGRGDAIVFVFPGTENEKYIKRVIGLPGERIKIKNNKIFINERLLKEDYIGSDILTLGDVEFELKEKEYLVLGDNRELSNDSRIWGPLSRENIIGKAQFVLYPFSGKQIIERPAYNI